MKTILKWISGLAIVIGLVGCSTQGQTDPGNTSDESATKSFFVNPKSIGPAYWSAAEKGVEQASEDLDVNVTFNAPSTTNSAEQINMIQDMLTRQIDGMGIAPNDPEAVGSIFDTALDQGVEVVTWDSDAPDTNRMYYLAAATDAELGTQFAEMIAEQIGGEGKIAFMVASLSAQNQTAKVEAAEKYLKENHPNIEVVTTVSSSDDQQKAYENAQNVISSYPDLKGLVGFAGAEAPAAAQAVQKAVKDGDIDEGQIAITGFAVPSLVAEYLEGGTIDELVTWDPTKLGYATVYTLNKLANDEEIGEEMEIPSVGTVTVYGSNILIGTEVITKDNVSDFDF